MENRHLKKSYVSSLWFFEKEVVGSPIKADEVYQRLIDGDLVFHELYVAKARTRYPIPMRFCNCISREYGPKAHLLSPFAQKAE